MVGRDTTSMTTMQIARQARGTSLELSGCATSSNQNNSIQASGSRSDANASTNHKLFMW